MFSSDCLFVIFCYLFYMTVNAEFQLPSVITPCSKSSSTFNQCMIENFNRLLPEILNGNSTYNIPNLNPLSMAEFNIKQGNKQIGLNMAMHAVDIYGIGTMEITHLELDMDAKTMKSRSQFRRLEIVGTHKSSGSIMVVKVSGEGRFNITAENMDYTYNTTFDYVQRDNGYEFATITDHDMKINTIGKVYFNLENMLGDGKLDGAVNDILNQYSKELAIDIFNEVKTEMMSILKAVLDGILRVFPISLVVLD